MTTLPGESDSTGAAHEHWTRPGYFPPRDLRTAGLAAHACLLLESARLYGLTEGGPTINMDRCDEVIEEAAAAGHVYEKTESEEAAVGMVAAWNATPGELAVALSESSS